MKTLSKKVLEAVRTGQADLAKQLLVQTQAKIARAKGKGLLKADTASRKISGLAKRVGSLAKPL